MIQSNRERIAARLNKAESMSRRFNDAINAPQRYNPDPQYLRQLADRTGLADRVIAERLGISARTLRAYLAIEGEESNRRTAPYAVQVALEALALALAL